MTAPSMMAGVQADLAALKSRVDFDSREETLDFFRAAWDRDLAEGRRVPVDREDFARKGLAIATCLPTRRTRERDEIACIRPRTLAPVRSLLVDPRAMTDAVFAAAGGGE